LIVGNDNDRGGSQVDGRDLFREQVEHDQEADCYVAALVGGGLREIPPHPIDGDVAAFLLELDDKGESVIEERNVHTPAADVANLVVNVAGKQAGGEELVEVARKVGLRGVRGVEERRT
jgi:hypothetical protein